MDLYFYEVSKMLQKLNKYSKIVDILLAPLITKLRLVYYAKSCLTLATPWTAACPHGQLLCPWDSPGKNTDENDPVAGKG